MRRRIALPWLLLAAAPASAQERAADRALAPMMECRKVPDSRVRAPCFDAALDKLQGAIGAHRIVIVDREEAQSSHNALFGPRFGKLETAASIDATVAAATPLGNGLWVLRLSTGATWRTIEASDHFQPRAGADVHIRRSPFGGYVLRLGKGWTVRAIRVG